LGAFPPIPIASRNAKLKRAVDFVRASRLFFHGAIYKCYDDFNRSDGAVVRLQNGRKMNMAKAIILAIFSDYPAARKCCLCGSACPQCFTSLRDFAQPPIGGTMLMRTPGTVAVIQKVSVLMYVLIYVLIYCLDLMVVHNLILKRSYLKFELLFLFRFKIESNIPI
jgi:hypothetical protein